MLISEGQAGVSRRVLALDYGRMHTGAAISDPSGTIVRPLAEIREAASPAAMLGIKELVAAESVSLVVIGIPASLKGGTGPQEQETQEFVIALKQELTVPVTTFDERFTSKIAAAKGSSSAASSHSLAACVLLEDYLGSDQFRRLDSKS